MDELLPLEDEYESYQCEDKLVIEQQKVPFGMNKIKTNKYISCPRFSMMDKKFDYSSSPIATALPSTFSEAGSSSSTSDKRNQQSVPIPLAAVKFPNPNLGFKYYHASKLASILYNFDIFDDRGFCDIRYVSITDNSGDWILYIQQLYPSTWGYGMSDRSKGEIDYGSIVTFKNKFIPYYGPDSLGNFNKSYKEFIDVILSDGGQTISLILVDSTTANNIKSVYLGLRVMDDRGSMIIRLNDATKNLLYLLSYVFEWITLFRPLLGEVYIICCHYKPDPIVTNIIGARIQDSREPTLVPRVEDLNINDDRFNSWLEYVTSKLVGLSTNRQLDISTIENLLLTT